MKQKIALLISAVLLLSLFAGCAKKTPGANSGATATPDATKPSEEMLPPAAAGYLLVNAGATLKLGYDKAGTVVDIHVTHPSGLNVEDIYEEYIGEGCKVLLSSFVKECWSLGYLSQAGSLLIKLENDSALPEEGFLDNLCSATQSTLETIGADVPIVPVGGSAQNAAGEIDLITAEALIKHKLGVEKLDNFTGNETPIDGLYVFSVSVNESTFQIQVNALTGAVSQGTTDEINGTQDGEPTE